MDAEEFFYQHSGYSWNPDKETQEEGRRRCAQSLAKAEAHAKANYWSYKWANDIHDDGVSTPETCEWCELVDEDGEYLASLGCIDDATQEYRRVIEAELAEEAIKEIT